MRVVILADLHCGHLYGLTPPGWQIKDGNERRDKIAVIERAMWDWYSERIDALRPVDVLICNGDMIDGKGARSGGTELITTARDEQIAIALEAIEYVNAERIHMIYGTPYHTGTEEDWESVLADVCGADIGSHDWYEADGVVIDCKHRVSSSTIPHGRYTGPAREALWNTLWSERELQPKANIIIRSHVHYHVYCGDWRKLIMTTPCMQAHSKFGARLCSGLIDIGFIVIDITDGGYVWRSEIMDMRPTAARTLPL